jgi:hypothetical protein
MSATLDVNRGSRARQGEKKRIRRGAEPIEMQERRHGYFPKVFVWRGQRYDVYAVERCWTVSRPLLFPPWGGRKGGVGRHCFRVRCLFGRAHDRREGTFEVYQDVRHNTWHLQRQVA